MANFTDKHPPFNIATVVARDDEFYRSRLIFVRSTVTTVEKTMWAGASNYIFPTAASVLDISSDSANDTAVGTGARAIQIEGLDENFMYIKEIVVLNGLATVNTVNSYYRVWTAVTVAAGSVGTTDGLVTIVHSSEGLDMAFIEAGKGQSTGGTFTVPANQRLLVSMIGGTVGKGQGVTMNLYTSQGTGAPFNLAMVMDLYESGIDLDFAAQPLIIQPGFDLEARAFTDAATAQGTILVRGLLVDLT